MQFEWDDGKNIINIVKHGISFETAREAFADARRKIRFNPRHSAEEMRYVCIGKVDDRIMTVRFTVRGSKIRIIGAGYWREGKKFYEQD